jgi:dienelactone hydrolase
LNSQGESPIVAVVETVRIPTGNDDAVVVDLHRGESADTPVRTVILCHGFKGHRRWGFIPLVAGRLAAAGIAAIAMDFSLNGRLAPESSHIGPGFPSPEAFRRNTIARECDDLERVIAWVRDGAGGRLDPGPLGLWGHSRGGVAVLLAALDDPDVAALVTWSVAARPDFYTPRQKREWRERGAMEFTDHESDAALAIDVAYLDDLEAHSERYHLVARVPALRCPCLFVHGEQDMVIPVADARALHDATGSDKELLRLATGHTFGYEGGGDDAPSAPLDEALRRTTQWFDRYLHPESS